MSTLVIDELFNGVAAEQPVTIERNISLAHVRPWIYKHGTLADGDLQLEILDGATILKTVTISYTDINAAIPATYFHGFIRFDFDSMSLRIPEGSTNKEYIFRFSMINYTTDPANFIGIVRNYERKIYPTYGTGVAGGEAPNDMIEPWGIELYKFGGN